MLRYLCLLEELDQSLSNLAKSDSSIEYANHIRDEFENVIDKLNAIKEVLGGNIKSGFDYFV